MFQFLTMFSRQQEPGLVIRSCVVRLVHDSAAYRCTSEGPQPELCFSPFPPIFLSFKNSFSIFGLQFGWRIWTFSWSWSLVYRRQFLKRQKRTPPSPVQHICDAFTTVITEALTHLSFFNLTGLCFFPWAFLYCNA